MTLDLAFEYPVVVTDRMWVDTESADVGPLTGGLVADLAFARANSCDFLLTPAFRGWGAHWGTEPGLTARVWDVGLDFGVRWSPAADAGHFVYGWWGLGTGVRASFLDVEWWDDVATVGVGGWFGGGVVIGRGKTRGTVALRADTFADFDRYTGTMVTASDTTTWGWSPGSARVSASVGVQVR